MQYLLGIDIGTSACKVAVFSADGSVAAQQNEAYPTAYPQPGWAEQSPDDWWDAVCRALAVLQERDGIDLSAVACIGVDGQSWSAIPVDENGRVLCPTPIWFDTRAAEICERVSREMGDELFALSGNPFQPSYTLPKILWYKENRPEVYQRAASILQANSFIVYRLTRELTQDRSQGYGLQCYDIRKGEWDLEACSRLGIRESLLPPLYDSHVAVGAVTETASAQTGIPAGVPVVAGGLDAACGTLGAGVIHPGETQEQGGQAGGMSICMDHVAADPRLILGNHVVPGLWLLQGGTVGGGGVCRWMERELGAEDRERARENGTDPFYELDRAAETVPPGSDGVVFLPYMAGERSPLWDPEAKGVYYGLDFSKTRAHLLRSGLEGVAYSLRHNLDIAEDCGAAAGTLYAMGGAANSRLWTQIKADVTGKRIVVPSSDTATTLGAAILAGVGAGIYRSFDEAVSRTVRITREHLPNPEHAAAYERGYRTYRALYPQLKPVMSRTSG